MTLGRTLFMAAAAVAAAAQPRIENAAVTQHDAAAGLEGIVDRLAADRTAAWIGFVMPATLRGDACCFQSDGLTSCRGCFLEPRRGDEPRRLPDAGAIALEPPNTVNVLLRVENGQIGKVRMFTPECALNGGGLPFHWIGNVRSGDATRLLMRIVRDTQDVNVRKAAMRTLALSREPEALQYIDRLLAK